MFYVSAAVLLLGGPILHWRAGQRLRGVWSFLRRLIVPVGLGVLMAYLVISGDFEGFKPVTILLALGIVIAAALGGLTGLLFCTLWDCVVARSEASKVVHRVAQAVENQKDAQAAHHPAGQRQGDPGSPTRPAGEDGTPGGDGE